MFVYVLDFEYMREFNGLNKVRGLCRVFKGL